MDFLDARILLINPMDALRASDRDVLIAAGFRRVMEAKEPPVEGVLAAARQWDVLVIEWRSGGLEMLRALRADEGTRYKTVIGLTSSAAPELVVEAKEAGVSGWLIRPMSDVAKRIQRAIERAATMAADAS
ncbi:hypothetical protein VY88_33135 [Azospirillum thiophilum]|uniref:Response regulatory domain-containing protein n=1 Tax=Azospirillum thiophilum TaxID=528244 RepID=A0AAC8ZWV5_9PROT|nr:hypothetical protein [Azospirillum thiophilum]ALG75757.1 hypothetical protein AL072_33030 [Azospirillum thiophilum]KJR61236.1 hypothetical protein VY88_33135 [Azospirillum thiophilum]